MGYTTPEGDRIKKKWVREERVESERKVVEGDGHYFELKASTGQPMRGECLLGGGKKGRLVK